MEEKEIEKLKKESEDCLRQKEEYLNCWKRERADFLNFKKDETERLGKISEIIKEDIVLDFLPILDNIYLAEKEISDDLKEHCWVKGIMKIKKQITVFLEKQGVKEIDCLNKKFDPNLEEAIEHIEKKDSGSGVVIQVLQRGYTLNNKLIRPARVKISK